MSFRNLMKRLTATRKELRTESTDTATDNPIASVEGVAAYEILNTVGCVEVSSDTAAAMGAFSEDAVSIDDVIDIDGE